MIPYFTFQLNDTFVISNSQRFASKLLEAVAGEIELEIPQEANSNTAKYSELSPSRAGLKLEAKIVIGTIGCKPTTDVMTIAKTIQ